MIIKWSNPCGDQATHFDGCIENPNANNSYNRKNVGTIYNAGPTICVSFTKEGKHTSGVGYHYKVKNTKVNLSKQHSSQWVPTIVYLILTK